MRVNPWLEEALREAEARRREPRGLQLIVEVVPGREDEVAAELRRLGYRVLGVMRGLGYILVDVPTPQDVERVARLPGVVMVSYNAPVWPAAVGLDQLFASLAWARDPILSRLPASVASRLLGVRVKPTAELDFAAAVATPKLPGPPSLPRPPIIRPGFAVKSVTETRRIIEAPGDNALSARTRVAVIDSGLSPHPAMRKRFEEVVLTLAPEPPGDLMGHGQWVSTCAFGDEAPSPLGAFKPVARAADGALLHVKVFNAVGPASLWQVMRAMSIAAEWGAVVVNMSLGGPLQGRVDEDPECRLVERLRRRYPVNFVVAAGNEGPGEWTVSSPGACPNVLTIGAYSWMYNDVAVYSSRGPNGGWYREHRSEWEEDHAKYGDLIVKPDVIAPGGGPAREGQRPIDLIYSGVTGWYDGFSDFAADGWDSMRGTSMATPHAAGLVALAIDRGVLPAAGATEEVKRRVARTGGEKSHVYGWGMLTWSRLAG